MGRKKAEDPKIKTYLGVKTSTAKAFKGIENVKDFMLNAAEKKAEKIKKDEKKVQKTKLQ